MTGRAHRSYGKGALVSHRCHLQMLDLITNKLGSENKQRLFSSQFGALFPFPNLQFQGQMFNILLRHLEKNSVHRNRLEFSLGGQKLEFSPRDFAMITGLRFDGWFEPPSESETHRVLFRQRQSISLDEIAEAFKAECRESGGRSHNALRLACLLVVFGVFVTMGGSVNHVDLKFFHLIDDVDAYLLFPWGQVAYDSLVKRTHRAHDVLEKHITQQKKIAFDANCFVLALQVWAYEVMPIIGRNCASKAPGTEHLFPRLRRWTTTMSIKYDVLHMYFSKLSAQTLNPMIPTEIEYQRLAELGVSGVNTQLKSEKKVLMNPEANIVEQENEENGSEKPNSSSRADQTVTVETGKNDQMSHLMRRVAELEQYVHSLKPKFGTFSSEENKKNKRLVSTAAKESRPVSLPPKKAKQYESAIFFDCRRTGLRSQSGRSGNSFISTDDAVAKTSRQFCAGSKASHSIDSNETVSGKSSYTRDVKIKMTLYDPNEKGIEPGVVQDFDAWCVESRKDSRRAGLKIPCRMVGVVTSDWFDSLWSRHGWLNTGQMDALINLLLVTSKNEPELFGSGWTALEMKCWDALCGTNHTVLTDRVGPYVVGLHPQTNPIHWAFASHVYGIGHIGGDHWVSYAIALDERCITVFDSRSMSSQWESMKTIFNSVCKNIQTLCEAHHVWKIRGAPNQNGKKWKVVCFKHPPQQPNNFDCGIMAIKYIECLISGNSVSVIDSGRCGFFRKSYCAKLFRVSEVQPDLEFEDIGL